MTDNPMCRCGCQLNIHLHYRPGTDCGHHGNCRRFRQCRWWHRKGAAK